jgi:hypothetical protein
MFKKIRRMLHRMKYGWNEEDVWQFDYYLCNVIIGGLVKLREWNHGVPGEIAARYKELEDANKEWLNILDNIISGFIWAKLYINGDVSEEDWKIKKKYFERGFSLFQKYFFHLWD